MIKSPDLVIACVDIGYVRLPRMGTFTPKCSRIGYAINEGSVGILNQVKTAIERMSDERG